MSLAIAQLSSFAAGAFEESFSLDSDARIDWGTATPVNSHTEIELVDELNQLASSRDAKCKPETKACEQELPRTQKALLLQKLREPFVLIEDHPVPQALAKNELIIRIRAIGLNPIDWKSADYGFEIPVLPFCSGRDFAGIVVKAPTTSSQLRVGDTVLCPSTDYRDSRTAAFQEYAVATDSTVCRVPAHISVTQGASLGVAYVAAALALGVCLGVPMPSLESHEGFDILEIIRNTPLGALPQDTIVECLAVKDSDRPRAKDWLVIWGGSSTSALFISQIARRAGLKVILVVDTAKHGARLTDTGQYVCIDSHDPERATEIIRGITEDKLRFAIDTVGTQTAVRLAMCLQTAGPQDMRQPHLVALAALPKERLPDIIYHSVPVKLFHEIPALGFSLMRWLEQALLLRCLELPHVDKAPGGLGGINDALNAMRTGQVSGKRLIVLLS